MLNLILASSSPRRREILLKFGYKFEVVTVQTSEIFEENLSFEDALLLISQTKVQATLNSFSSPLESPTLVVGADTVVCLGDQVLGKPLDNRQAFDFLSRLSGQIHQVKTSVNIFHSGLKEWAGFVETTQVKMRNLSNGEIEAYIQSGEPQGKAGAYAIQGKGGKLVESFQGSWHNVVGFPIESFENLIQQKGWSLDVHSGKPK